MSSSSELTRARWSGLDGLRALAVIAVVAYHFAPGTVPGGFLGVDLFFVLSGYLITRMIAAEFLRHDRFGFTNFYRRRARRLLPGLVVVLVAVLAAAAFWRDQLSTVRAATLAAAGYVSNWWLSYAHQSYFVSAGRPSMLQHLWSLAVEEQFYLCWPLVAIGVLTLAGRLRAAQVTPALRAGCLAGVAAVLAAASATEMALLAVAHNAPYASDASRLYYGTDTHSMGLLLGAALGALAAGRSRPQPGAGGRPERRLLWLTDVLAGIGLVALTVAVCAMHETNPVMYRGGFLAVAAVGAFVVAAVARRGSHVGHALDRRVLRWVAARSYAAYLWHWPIAVVTRPGVDVSWPGPVVLLLRVGATVVLADVTYRMVEAPVRARGLQVSLRHGLRRMSRVIAGQAPVGARLAAAGLVMAVLLAGGVLAAGPKPTLSAGQKALAAERGGRALPLGSPPAPAPTVLGRLSDRISDDASAPATTSATPPPTTPPAPKATGPARPLPPISAFGDSVMLGARNALNVDFPRGTLDAVEGRQADPILGDVEHDAATGRLNPLVVIGIGDNGYIDAGTLRHALQSLRDIPRVIVVNNRVGRYWQNSNNRTIAKVVPHFANAKVLDWHSASARHPAWFYDDGIHLTSTGAVAYTKLIVATARRIR